jgi:hypothetical protein
VTLVILLFVASPFLSLYYDFRIRVPSAWALAMACCTVWLPVAAASIA